MLKHHPLSDIDFSTSDFENLTIAHKNRLVRLNDQLCKELSEKAIRTRGLSIFITGSWGIGKTRAAYFVANYLFNKNPAGLFKTLVFNHEMIIFSSAETSLRILLARMAKKFYQLNIADLRKELTSLTSGYIESSQTGLGVQFLGISMSRTIGGSTSLPDSLPRIQKRFTELTNDGWRVVLIVDDLDRLKPEDQLVALHFIQLMRSIPGIILIVPLEKMVVGKGINKVLNLGLNENDLLAGNQFIERFADHTVVLEGDYFFYRTEIFTKMVSEKLQEYFSGIDLSSSDATRQCGKLLASIEFYNPLTSGSDSSTHAAVEDHRTKMKISPEFRLADLAWQCLQYLFVLDDYSRALSTSARGHTIDTSLQSQIITSSDLLTRLSQLYGKDEDMVRVNEIDEEIWLSLQKDLKRKNFRIDTKTFIESVFDAGVGNNIDAFSAILRVLTARQDEELKSCLTQEFGYKRKKYLLFELFLEQKGLTDNELQKLNEALFNQAVTRRRLHSLADLIANKIYDEFVAKNIASKLITESKMTNKQRIFTLIFNSCYDAINGL